MQNRLKKVKIGYGISEVDSLKWEELYFFEFEIEIGLEAFHALNSSQEKMLKLTKEKFDKFIAEDEALNSIEPRDQGSYYSQFFEREEMTINELQRQQRYSMVLSVFSFFEGKLKSICQQIESSFNFKIKIDDLNSQDDLMRYWKFLEKVFEIDTKSIEIFFTPIKQQKIVRNIIAHQDGIVDKDKRKKIVIVRGLSVKEFGDEAIIELQDSTYVLYLLEKMGSFFKKLILAIDNRYSVKNTIVFENK